MCNGVFCLIEVNSRNRNLSLLISAIEVRMVGCTDYGLYKRTAAVSQSPIRPVGAGERSIHMAPVQI